MGKTLKELSDMSWSELAVWLAFSSVEPLGDLRADLRAAITTAVIANCNRNPGTPPYSVSDFLPVFWKGERMVEVTNEEALLAELAKAGLHVEQMLGKRNG